MAQPKSTKRLLVQLSNTLLEKAEVLQDVSGDSEDSEEVDSPHGNMYVSKWCNSLATVIIVSSHSLNKGNRPK